MTSPFKIVAGTTAPGADPAEEFFKQHDPALRAVDAHRRAAKIFNEAVRIEFASYGKVTEAAYARLNEITRARTDDCFAAGYSLVKTQPTTMLGAIAMLQYLATLFDEPGIPMESNVMPETVEGEAWPCAVFRTLASALMEVQS
ncbi:hypothetical protein SAMN05443247_06649 [Bradyrhizobium erythrophlei]|nr:hypothetical protein SAMN05443247_06649 [Bradyrhizobium erythrophlei]